MRTLLALALLAMSTSGCATVVSRACPREVEYSREVEKTAAAELDDMAKIGVGPTIRNQFMPDYGRLRDQARACRGAK